MTLRRRIVASLAILFLSFLGLGGFALDRLGKVRQASDGIAAHASGSMHLLSELADGSHRYRNAVLLAGMRQDDSLRAQDEATIASQRAEVTRLLDSYRPVGADEMESRGFVQLAQAWRAYIGLMPAAQPPGRPASTREQLNNEEREAFARFERARDQLSKHMLSAMQAVVQHSHRTYDTAYWLILGAVLLGALLSLGIALNLAASVTSPLLRLAGVMDRMTRGELEAVVTDQERADEIGSMARALEVFRARVRDGERLAREQAEMDVAQSQRAQKLDELVCAFGEETRGMLDGVRQAAERLNGTASRMGQAAEEGARLTEALSTASEGASGNAQTAAAATEELASSIGEITRQVGRSAEVSRRAVAEAERTDRTVRDLAETASKIGDVVRLIADIAGQTNLLALNATIEAARAGEAGKGFAVVASEVKSLASQTARATEEIGQQVGAIQGATGQAVEAIRSIGLVVAEIDQTAAAIAAAVEQQGAATQEIARNIAGTAEAASTVSRETAVVRDSAGASGDAAREVREASRELNDQANGLRARVDRFLNLVRAA
ncbi:methyl-accepting chemotaxis protein [Roseomonas marmotae]|uniref:Methyl-accepting chemotaxis protein n=1 Tax=Roseomonas marmotae TaxID=2768161 RepID=A0ABS3KBQ2_9PROT|nr:HAMP domain-containing methyl-accepting chemotaxis protein [Roseomonas marmotae]MBO1074902.1 methyl-accepting chemotaxis protein [Roseomonas marmotae]QTI80596.1 methyl-accepting chemotaxis protein [Roseomonas marmotae]